MLTFLRGYRTHLLVACGIGLHLAYTAGLIDSETYTLLLPLDVFGIGAAIRAGITNENKAMERNVTQQIAVVDAKVTQTATTVQQVVAEQDAPPVIIVPPNS